MWICSLFTNHAFSRPKYILPKIVDSLLPNRLAPRKISARFFWRQTIGQTLTISYQFRFIGKKHNCRGRQPTGRQCNVGCLSKIHQSHYYLQAKRTSTCVRSRSQDTYMSKFTLIFYRLLRYIGCFFDVLFRLLHLSFNIIDHITLKKKQKIYRRQKKKSE